MLEEIIGGAIVAAIGAIGLAFRGQIQNWWSKRQPIRVAEDHSTPDSWQLVLPSTLPSLGRPGREARALTVSSPDTLYPTSSEVAYHWIRTAGGIDYKTTRLRLFLQGATKDTISISNIRVVIDKRQPPARGAHVTCPSAGSLDTLTLSTDLDASHPTLWAFSEVDHETVGNTPYFASHSISLSQGEIFDLCVVAKTERLLCDWHIEIDYRVGLEKKGSIRLPSKSSLSFRTSGHPENGFLEEWDWAWYEESGPSFIEVSERNRELNSLPLDLDPTVEFDESDELSDAEETGELTDMEGYVPDQPPPKPSDG